MKGATRTMPAKSVGASGREIVMALSLLLSFLFGGSRLSGVDGPLAKCNATAEVTAVPRLWPSKTIRDGGILATSMAQFTAATPSAMRPASLGSPVELPKPR